MAINRWEPMRDFMTLRQAVDRLFDEAFTRGEPGMRGPAERVWRLPIDAYATENELVLQAPICGVSPEDVHITVEGDTLTIRGEMPAPLENVDYIFQERPFGQFVRSLTLNVPVQADKAEASFENGMLTLTIPKAEDVKPKSIKVKTKK